MIFTLHVFILFEYFESCNALVSEKMHDVPRKMLSTVIQTVRFCPKTLILNAVNDNFQDYHHRISLRAKILPMKSFEICLSDNHQNFQVKLINLDTIPRARPLHTSLPLTALCLQLAVDVICY